MFSYFGMVVKKLARSAFSQRVPECLSLRTCYELKRVSRPLQTRHKNFRVVPRTAKFNSTEIDFTFVVS